MFALTWIRPLQAARGASRKTGRCYAVNDLPARRECFGLGEGGGGPVQGNRAAAGQARAWAVKRWRGRLALPGRALLACSSAGGTRAGPDRAEEKYLIGFRYCEDLRAYLASGGGSGASWWSGRGRTDRLIDLPPKSRSISSGMHMTK